MPAPSGTVNPPTEAAPPTRRRHRAEIDGLRALAVSLVVLYHVFTGRVSGGVDVFLALTGFFLVHSMLGQFRRNGRVRPLTAISRSLGRLVPAAVLVLVGTVLASAWVVPATRWREIATHLMSAVTFTENRQLVEEAVDYSANNALASPMQQFWSLSIQVQVLIATPLAVAAVAAVLRRTPWTRHARTVTIITVAGITAASLYWSVLLTAREQQVAYFSTLPRLWELGVGALAALLLGGFRPHRWIGAMLGWAGILGLIACGALLDGAHQFPGWRAGWPVLCAITVLVAADTGGRFGAHRLLSLPSARWVGDRSYALYLWHWPVLVLYLVHTRREAPSAKGALAVIAVSVVLAAATYHLVERPAGTRIRSWRPTAALATVLACAAPLLAGGMAATTWMDRGYAQLAAAADHPAYPGAAALSSPAVATGGFEGVRPLPPLPIIREDWPDLPTGSSCTTEVEELDPVPAETTICVFGGDDLARRVIVVGDSHAAHWLPPFSTIGQQHGWQVISVLRGGCNLSTESEFLQEGWPSYEECAAWRLRLVDRIISLEPDVVVAMGTRTDAGDVDEWLPQGYVAAWQQLVDVGVPVIGLRDNPRHAEDVPDCMARWGDTAPACELPRSSVYDDRLVRDADEFLPAGVALLDTSPYFCTDTVCPALVGNVRVYMDGGHVTATYMRSVAPLLETDFLALTGW